MERVDGETAANQWSEARAINAAGRIVGCKDGLPGTFGASGFQAAPLPVGATGCANGINRTGSVVGVYQMRGGRLRPFVMDRQGEQLALEGISTDLDVMAEAINNPGAVLMSIHDGAPTRAVWQSGALQYLDAAFSVRGRHVLNDAGDVVGGWTANGRRRAAIWRQSTAVVLKRLTSRP